MVSNSLIDITIEFQKEYDAVAQEVAASIIAGRIIDKELLTKKIIAKMQPIIDELFTSGIAATNKIVKEGVARLVTELNVPYKYNKDLLLNLNDKSIFTGYYDRTYKDLYSRGEIARIKNTILQAKYGGWTESKTVTAIRKATGMTTKRALLLARNETARLTSVANEIYYQKAIVRNKYKLVWYNTPGNVRPDHAAMAGKVADANGKFQSGKCGLVPGPPLACDPYNCKCYTDFVER